jgi:acyl-CoA dehydrogenase
MSRGSEERALLAESADQLFAELAHAERDADIWEAIEANGMTVLFDPEDEGGFGGGWEDAFVLLHSAAFHALRAPLAETLLARRLARQAQLDLPPGAIAIAFREGGSARAVCWGNAVDHVAVISEVAGARRLQIVAARHVEIRAVRATIAQEPLADLHFDDDAPCESGSIDEDPFLAGALMRAASMAGALSATLDRSVQHANDRQQFGRPIGKFQAVQHSLALLANEVAAVNCAAVAACRAADRAPAEFAIAAAKLRANRAAGVATAIAHQVHGAIGFTMEHKLHLATQRLWTWRSEYGNDRYWATRLGEIAAAHSGEGLWRYLTMLTDGVRHPHTCSAPKHLPVAEPLVIIGPCTQLPDSPR